MSDANDLKAMIRPHIPAAISTMYEIAYDTKVGKTDRKRAIKDILARGFARPASKDPDPAFKPSAMSAETRAELEAMLQALDAPH